MTLLDSKLQLWYMISWNKEPLCAQTIYIQNTYSREAEWFFRWCQASKPELESDKLQLLLS